MTKARDLANIISGGFTADDIPSLDTAKITTGTFADARMPSTVLNSNVDLTNLSASNLTSGTLPDARFPATLPAISGANLTNLPAGGDYVKLATTTISSDTSSVSFDGYFSSTYKNYFIIGSSLRPNNDPGLNMRYRISNADVTGSNYVSTRNTIRLENSTNAMEEDNNSIKQSYLSLAATLTNSNNTDGNSSKRAFNFNLFLHDPLNTSYMKYCFGSTHHTYDNTNDVWYYHTHFGGTYTADGSALSGFTVFPASGSFTDGTISLYGLKH